MQAQLVLPGDLRLPRIILTGLARLLALHTNADESEEGRGRAADDRSLHDGIHPLIVT